MTIFFQVFCSKSDSVGFIEILGPIELLSAEGAK
jgi:hypothetical protein